jgi:hypothetical protein
VWRLQDARCGTSFSSTINRPPRPRLIGTISR